MSGLCEKEKQKVISGNEHTCPFRSDYRFHVCPIKSCAQNTTATASGCLQIDRVRPEGAKIISDAEITLYKYGKKISPRLVQIKRKKAVGRVKRILILHRYIAHIKDRYGHLPHGRFTIRILKSLERRYPLHVKELQFENWMWEYFLDEEEWASFSSKLEEECRSLLPFNLLHIKIAAYEYILSKFNGEAIK